MDFLDRADALQALGKTVLLSRCAEFHRIAAFLHRYTSKPVGIILSIGLLNELFKAEVVGKSSGRFVGILRPAVQGRRHAACVSLEKPHAPASWSLPRRSCRRRTACISISISSRTDGSRAFPARTNQLLVYTGRDVCRMIHADDERWRELVPEVAWTMAERHARLGQFLIRGLIRRRRRPCPRRCEGGLEQVEVRAAIHAAELLAWR